MVPDFDPLVGGPPAEVPLPNAPLIRVIAQIRFPTILKIQDPDFVAPFQEAVRNEYPILQPEHNQTFALGQNGIEPGKQQTTWRFCELSGGWRVALNPEFLALDTTTYTSRNDFFKRLTIVTKILEQVVKPAQIERLGLRYIDRISGDAMDKISGLVRPEFLGVLGTVLSNHIQQSISETIVHLPSDEERMRIRWGQVPAGKTIELPAIDPINETSWILDLDMFSTKKRPFSSDEAANTLRGYAERIYKVFRWVVTDEFLHLYGGRA